MHHKDYLIIYEGQFKPFFQGDGQCKLNRLIYLFIMSITKVYGQISSRTFPLASFSVTCILPPGQIPSRRFATLVISPPICTFYIKEENVYAWHFYLN